ncbi:MAG: TRAP transporter large permease subunit [Alphaproteobacteria bacterium]
MEILFLIMLIGLMAATLAAGYPVAFALPGSAILTILTAAGTGYLFTGDVGAYFSVGGPSEWLNAGITNFRGIYWEPERDTLIAIPLFIFMGIMLERSKIAADLLITMAQLFGRIPGGLGVSVVLVGALLAATTGILGATVIAMGLISLPVMLRNGYSRSLSTGIIAASGTLGQIIPPSIVLIILADQLSNATDQALNIRSSIFKSTTGSSNLPSEYTLTSASAGDMFLGAILPGLVLVGLYVSYILVSALIRPKIAPPVPREGKFDFKFVRRVVVVLVPPLSLIMAVLGSILLGIATVNQAGAIGATGALIMAGYRLKEGQKGAFYPAFLAFISIAAIFVLINVYDLNIKNITSTSDAFGVGLAAVAVFGLIVGIIWSIWRAYKINDTLKHVMVETAKTTSLVFIILLGAAMLTAAFRAFGGEDLVRDFLIGFPGGFFAKFAIVMAVIFLLGFFLDFIEIAVVVVPIIAPVLLADPSANITAVWLGVMIGVNMQTSFLTPPFGFALFYLRGVAPAEVKTTEIYRGVVPFIMLQLVALGIVGLYPSLVNYLPNRIYLGSANSPPPRNPRLQRCIEARSFVVYDATGNRLRAAIDRMAGFDITFIPAQPRGALANSFKQARMTFARVAAVRKAEAALKAYTPEYEPQHRVVRGIQRRIQEIDAGRERTEQEIRSLMNGGGEAEEVDALRVRLARMGAEKARIEKRIPKEWKGAHARFMVLAKAERLARLNYRRTVDSAYEPILETRKMIAGADALAGLKDRLERLKDIVANAEPAKARKALREVERALRGVYGTSKIQSRLSRARRALRKGRVKRQQASERLQEALSLYQVALPWRLVAKGELAARLESYNEVIKDTIGLRLQVRLTSEQATQISSCLSVHRDISLNF